jgi:hypothetical protein
MVEMNPLKDIEGIDAPVLTRAAEAIQIIAIKNTWAAHEMVSYVDETDDVQDLVEAERLLIEMRLEINSALASIQTEINRADGEITVASLEERQKAGWREDADSNC